MKQCSHTVADESFSVVVVARLTDADEASLRVATATVDADAFQRLTLVHV